MTPEIQSRSVDFIRQPASCEFIGRHENIVMVGNPGTGKTHLMTAIGIKACLWGYKVIFKTATTLVTEFREAKDSYSLRKLEKSIAAANLLLLDELSYASFGLEESELLFKVIAERSERTSTMITTNLEFSKWPEMFKDATLVSALVDSLTYHSHILNMNVESYRFQNARKRKSQSGSEIHGHMAQFFAITVAQKFTAMWLIFSLTFTFRILIARKSAPPWVGIPHD